MCESFYNPVKFQRITEVANVWDSHFWTVRRSRKRPHYGLRNQSTSPSGEKKSIVQIAETTSDRAKDQSLFVICSVSSVCGGYFSYSPNLTQKMRCAKGLKAQRLQRVSTVLYYVYHLTHIRTSYMHAFSMTWLPMRRKLWIRRCSYKFLKIRHAWPLPIELWEIGWDNLFSNSESS